jgi:epoxide hydrolase-like predicted phosphatase
VDELYHTVFDSPIAAQATVGQAPAAAVWAHATALYKLAPPTLARLQADFWSGDRRDDALVAFIRALRPAYKTGILSNAWSDGRAIIGEMFGLADAVDDIVVSAEVGVAKPDGRIFAFALARLDVRPEEVVFVDDFARNIEGARAFGMQVVHFRDTAQAIAEVQAYLGRAA